MKPQESSSAQLSKLKCDSPEAIRVILSRLDASVWAHGCAANRGRQTKGFRNTPSSNADESFPDEIRVCDPRHPLYGRTFRVVRRTSHRGGNFLPSFEVEFRDSVTLLVPVAATDPHVSSASLTKLSMYALLDLLNVVDSYDHERSARSSLDDAAADPSTTDRRRHCRSSGGGLS